MIDLRDVSVRVQAKHLRGISEWEGLYDVHVLLYRLALGDGVASEELEGVLEHVVPKPNLESKEVEIAIIGWYSQKGTINLLWNISPLFYGTPFCTIIIQA